MKVIAVISYLIFTLFILGFYNLIKKNSIAGIKPGSAGIRWVLSLGLLMRIIIAVSILGFSSDMGLFRFWAQKAAEDLFHIYQGDFYLDYPPFYLYVLFFIGKTAGLLGLTGGESLYNLLLKMPSIAADLITAYLLYRLARKRLPGVWPLAVAGIYVFNPAVFINSAAWGQIDSFLALFLALGFLILDSEKPEMAGIPLAIAALIKPQGLILLPVAFFVLLKRRDWMLIVKTALFGLLTGVILVLPFAVNQEPLWIYKLYINTAEGYKYVSLNAFNFFSLIGDNLKPDSEKFIIFSYQTWGYIFIFAMLIFTAVLYWKGKGSHLQYVGALVLSMGVFMLSVRMHERYMFPVLFFLAVIFILTRDKWSLLFYGIASFTIFVNTYVVLDRMIKDDYPHVPPDDPVLLLISFINVILFAAVLIWAWRSVVKGKTDALEMKDSSSPQQHSSSLWFSFSKKRDASQEHYEPLRITRKDIVVMTAMTIVYLAIALINLGSSDVPQTEWAGRSTSDGFIIDLGSEQNVSRLTFYSGLGEGTYNVWYQDSSGTYYSLENMEVDDFYKWHILEISHTTSRIMVKVNKPGGMIKEIGVFGEDPNKPLPIEIKNLDLSPAQGELLHLADEQHLARYRDDYMTSTYFDEIYHARTAYEHLNRIKPYEWTHPPFGKILISIGIAIFGMNTFGWRIVGTLTGVIMIPLMYLFGKKLFQKSFYGFCAAFLMMFDLMHFAQTRIATIDSYTTLFVILMYYYMADYYLQKSYEKGFYKSLKPLLLSGLFFGLGAATKWSALYGAPGLALIFFMAKYNEYKDYKKAKEQYSGKAAGTLPEWVEKFIPVYMWKTILYCVLFFIVIPGTIYILSYIPYLMVPGMKFSDILEYQKSMYRYHSQLKSTHSFQSEWWTWPLMIRPIWYYQGKDLPAGMASTIASFGNPAVWWAGVLAFIAAIKAAWDKNKAMILVVVAVISQYIPWMLITRSAFIYHFFPMVPFMMLSVVYVIKKQKEKGINMKYIYGYLGLVMLLFIMFYPAVSGLVVPKDYIHFLRWFPSWVF
ncbi:MAG TPA: phospholipid carrier-dependent glycosyltransferase [Clostridiales bacterium]|nr:phospholipid carrier-dependent glycosyltransferase [Clostridiales bacterium]